MSSHDLRGKIRRSVAIPAFGRLVRRHRHRLNLSQEKLAQRAGISCRHMSFLETGKARPSREIAIEIANALAVPTHELGVFLEVAGYVAPPAPPTAIGEAELAGLLQVIREPALMHDRYGIIRAVNGKATALFGMFVGAEALRSTRQGHALSELLRPKMKNWRQFQAFFRRRVFLEVLRSAGEPELERLLHRWSAEAESLREVSGATVPVIMEWKEQLAEFRLLTATLGTPSDVALRDFRLGLILPSNELAVELVGEAEKLAEGDADSEPTFPPSAPHRAA
jgi:transcriptional regulator with XRE-family HTH domain